MSTTENVERAASVPQRTNRKRTLVPGREREETRGAVMAGLPNLSPERPRGERSWRAKLVRGYSFRISYRDGPLCFEDDDQFVPVTESEGRYLADQFDKQVVSDGGRRYAQDQPKFVVLNADGEEVTAPRRRRREAPVRGQDPYERHLRRQEIMRRRQRAEDEAELVGDEA